MLAGEDRRDLAVRLSGATVRDGLDGERRFRGYAAVFDERTAIGNPLTWGFYEEIAPGAFTTTLATADVRKLIDHDPYYIVSRMSAGTLELMEDRWGLAVDSALDTQLSYVTDLIANLDNRNITGMSFGFYVRGDQWTTEKVSTSDGQTVQVEVRRITEVELIEVSSVTFPAYPGTEAGLRASDDVRAVALALRRRDRGDQLIEARSAHCPALATYPLDAPSW